MTNRESEAYAALVLVKTAQIREPFSVDWLKDRPDLQVGKFGIEVTRAIDSQEAEQCQIDSEVLACPTYEFANEYIRKLKYPEKYRSEPKQLPGSDRFSLISGGGYDDDKPLDLIVKAIAKKSKIFPQYPEYKSFLRRGLYISDEDLYPNTAPLSAELILKSINDSVFDVVFIHQRNNLIVVEKSDGIIQKYPFSILDRNDTICEAKRVVDSPNYEEFCERAKAYRKSIGY